MQPHFNKENGVKSTVFTNNAFLKQCIGSLFCCLACLLLSISNVQGQTVSGTVSDESGQTLIGASIVIKDTGTGTITDVDGKYRLDNVKAGTTLVFSYTGYTSQEIMTGSTTTINVILVKGSTLDEVVVTGVFDARSKMESSIAISTMDAKAIEKLTPVSAADLFTNTPGVYVNSSAGETRNQVYARGVSAGSNYSLTSNVNGYYYLSLQEDGLPVTAISDGNFLADLFFRADATVKRLESVRGGSSSITSVNAPGGIFNFLSKNGIEDSKEVRLKFGLEGRDANPFYRIDMNFGENLANGVSYNVGGFYRRSDGAYHVGYPMNRGGQIKANLTKIYDSGSIRFFGKYLDDINGFTQVIPAQGFEDITLAPGVNFGDSYAFPEAEFEIPNGSGGNRRVRTNVPQQAKDISLGFNLNQELSDAWTLRNDFKYSSKSYEANHNAATSFTSFFDVPTYFFTGVFGPPGSVNRPGILTLTNRETNQVMARVDFSPPVMGPPSFNVLENNLPQSVQNAVLYGGSNTSSGDLDEVMNQLTLSRKWKNASLNIGAFYSNSQANALELTAGVLSLNPIQNAPVPFDVTYAAVDGQNYQLSSPDGFLKLGGSFGYGNIDYAVDQLAFFVGNNFSVLDNKLNIDWGLRYETSTIKGTNERSVPNPANFSGGLDGNPLTVYDNFSQILGQNVVDFDTNIDGFSLSAGANYRINENNAFYVRFTRAQKAPDLRFYATTYTSEFARDNVAPRNQNITQFEVAYKLRNERIKATFTPFISDLSDVTTIVLTADDNNQFYFPDPQFNSLRTIGLEVEFDWNVATNFSIAGGATLQDSEYTNWLLWDTGEAPRGDDKLTDYTGNKAENTPNLLINLTPTYATDKFYALLQYRYMGERWANQPNAYTIPGFSQLNLGAGYNFTDRLSLSVNINNLTNTMGIMSSFAPGNILQVFNPNQVTADVVAADPNAVHPIVTIQPRAYFMTLTYRL